MSGSSEPQVREVRGLRNGGVHRNCCQTILFLPLMEGGRKGTPPSPSPAPARDLHHRRGLPEEPVPEDDPGGVTPHTGSGTVGGSMRFENLMVGGMLPTPLPKIGNCALMHASRTCFPHESSGGTTVPDTYLKLITGGRIRSKGGGGRPATPPHPCRGGWSKYFFKVVGG